MPARIALGHIAPWELPLDALIMLVSIYGMIRPGMSVFLAAAGTLKLREGLRLGLDYIGTEHILLGMVRDNDGIALPILLGLGADTETIRSWAPRAARVFASALLLACATALIGYGNSAGKPTTTPPASDPAGLVSYSARAPSAVGEIVVRYTDIRRLVHFPGHPPQPRPLVTVIRYPAVGDPSHVDVRSAAPATKSGPFPLIVFGHGFNVTPAIYARLLRAWASAGYVVAAPIFPLGNKNAPGGADESDIVNQPADMSFVITRMLAASAAAHGILSRLVDPHEIAVSGQSDGGETALATAYDTHYLDRRIDAAIILSGAELSSPGFYFPHPSPPLLASQGTADVTNLPHYTYDFFHAAPAPKFLLRLLGAPHLGQYTDEQPQLRIVERVTIAFLDRYLTSSTSPELERGCGKPETCQASQRSAPDPERRSAGTPDALPQWLLFAGDHRGGLALKIHVWLAADVDRDGPDRAPVKRQGRWPGYSSVMWDVLHPTVRSVPERPNTARERVSRRGSRSFRLVGGQAPAVN